MNVKHIAAALSLALAGSAAMAFEATEFKDPVITPAGVSAIQAGKTQEPTAVVVSRGEATQFADVVKSKRDRAEVRAEARTAAREHKVNPLYIGG
jgi:hypothetical protein